MKYKIKPEHHDNTLLLSDLIETKELAHLELNITVPRDIRVTIIDDIKQGLAQTAEHKFSFTVKENSELNYHMRLVENQTYQGDICNNPETVNQSLTKEVTLNLAGSGAHANAHAIWLGKANRQLIVETMQHHQVPNTSSTCIIKTVLDDEAKMKCTSMIKVDKEAQQTQAEQSNKNIMLSSGSRAISVPQLEIEADDVSCKHGAAMSRFDDEQRFYLESRGINSTTTQQLLIEAFLAS